MTIYFAADHAGFEMKNMLIAFVRDELGMSVEDCGADQLVEDDDYPDFVQVAAEKVSGQQEHRAIILGGSGQGEAMAANRYPGVRAAVFYGGPDDIVQLSRTHNDANILSLGARFLDDEGAKRVVRLWLETPFSAEARHVRRINKIDQIG